MQWWGLGVGRGVLAQSSSRAYPREKAAGLAQRAAPILPTDLTLTQGYQVDRATPLWPSVCGHPLELSLLPLWPLIWQGLAWILTYSSSPGQPLLFFSCSPWAE